MLERRKYERTKVSKSAKISFAHCERLLDCRVFDVSLGGVGIEVENPAEIPEVFELTFDAARTLRPCRVAWRSAQRLGAAFVQSGRSH
jgi:c-di-GMP-binding flagellar brake protein YcgR